MASDTKASISLADLTAHFAGADPVIARIIAESGHADILDQAHPRRLRSPFESLARAIANQQLSGIVAARILERLVALYGTGDFPTPQQMLDTPDADLRKVGFSFAKIAALKDLAAKTLSGVVPTSDELAVLSDDEIVERLVSVRGIGRWTAEMLLMFQLGRPDVLPVDDFGVRNGFRLAYGLKGMPQNKALLAYGDRWRPHRSAAAWYLWRAVDLHKAGTLPKSGRAPRIALVVAKAKALGRKAAKVAKKQVKAAVRIVAKATKTKKAAKRSASKPAPRRRPAGRTPRSPASSRRRK